MIYHQVNQTLYAAETTAKKSDSNSETESGNHLLKVKWSVSLLPNKSNNVRYISGRRVQLPTIELAGHAIQ